MNISPKIGILLTLLIASFVVGSANAVESATPSATEEVTESIKNRLKETINAVDEAPSPSQMVGYVGKIKDVVKNTLVVEDKSGKRNILVDDETTIVRSPGNTTIKLDSVRIGDAVIVMGSSMDNSETKGKRIIVSDTPFAPPTKISGIARIAKVTSTTITMTAVPENTSLTLSLGAKSVIKTTQGSLEVTDLENGDQVIYSALVDAKDATKMTATVVMRIKDSMPELETSPATSPKPTASPK